MSTLGELKQVQERNKDNSTCTPDLSFLDKPEMVEAAYQAVKGEWTYFPTTEDEWKLALITAISAIKRMAKEGV